MPGSEVGETEARDTSADGMKKRTLAFVAIVAFSVIAVALVVRPPRRERVGRLALATILPVADMARNVAGDRFVVETLLPPGASPHTFEPTARELMALHDAEIVFKIGLDLELWADKLLSAAGGERLRIVTVSGGIDLLPNMPDEHAKHDGTEAQDHHHADGHEHGEFNPHVWLDPVNAVSIVGTMAEAFADADPEGARVYAANAARYTVELARLDTEYRCALSGLESRRVVAFHNSFSYLARRYGIEVVGLVEKSPGKEPDARHVRALIDRIRALGVKAVLIEPQLSPKVAEALARDAGASVVRVDPLGDPAAPERSTYLALMRSNLKVLVNGLGGRFGGAARVDGGDE